MNEDPTHFDAWSLCFGTAADELHKIAHSGIARRNHIAARCLVAVPVVASLAVECALKALSSSQTGDFKRSHDLIELYDELPSDVRRLVEAKEPSLRTILESHRHTFVEWRYPARDETNSYDPKLMVAHRALMETLHGT